jgi:predicted transcriptional regulator
MKQKAPPQPSSIRIDDAIKQAVMREAEAENRTFSQQVVHILKQHVDRRKSRS